MKAVLFDLDNTLYPEIEFVKSGFRAVARYLSSRYHFHEDFLLTHMLSVLQKDGRGKVFDSLLHELGIYQEERVKLLVYLYRSHKPNIGPYKDCVPTFQHLRHRGMRLGVLTDGIASVQRNKIAALGLEDVLDAIVCTDELGSEYWKPSVVPYKLALELLGVSPSNAAYVGDDPSKDFLGPNSMGMLTIQVAREVNQNPVTNVTPEGAAARFVVKELEDTLTILEGKTNAY
jgi:putative hydrolase of the HAD superfamily